MDWLVDLGRWVAKAHAYIFYVLRRPFKAMDDRWADFKVGVILTVGMLFAAITITNLASISVHHRLFLANYDEQSVTILWLVIGGGIAIVNTSVRSKVSQFERDFQTYSVSMQIVSAIAVWLSLLVVVVAVGWTGSIVSNLLH